ncbi:MAG TPA: hypothetical protein QF646_03040 [Candidatus Poseidoniales archaeon]|nr:hypothetical protein [Candidatus Poseidoniales archaeon]
MGGESSDEWLVGWIERLVSEPPVEVRVWSSHGDVIECFARFNTNATCLTMSLVEGEPRLDGRLDITPDDWNRGDVTLERRLEDSWLILRNGMKQLVWSLPDHSSIDVPTLLASWCTVIELSDTNEIRRRRHTIMRRELNLVGRWLETADMNQLKEEITEQVQRAEDLERALGGAGTIPVRTDE